MSLLRKLQKSFVTPGKLLAHFLNCNCFFLRERWIVGTSVGRDWWRAFVQAPVQKGLINIPLDLGPKAESSPHLQLCQPWERGGSAAFNLLLSLLSNAKQYIHSGCGSSSQPHPVPPWVGVLVCQAKPCCWRMWHLAVCLVKSIICVWTSSNACGRTQGHPLGSQLCLHSSGCSAPSAGGAFFPPSFLHITNCCRSVNPHQSY